MLDRMTEPVLDLTPNTEPTHNLPEYSVSELSAKLKRTVEDAYPRVRVRGEVSRLSRPSSGHLYLNLKDADAVLAAVCWRTTASYLRFVPEDGLEVICSGRITTYPGRSTYQLIIDSIEPAGEGALMALLEKRRKQFAAEGLFDDERKRALPFLPDVIGVVTSPSGAVLQDIKHRLADRFPRQVLLWPVVVQGEHAAAQVAAAIAGFNKLDANGPVPRPDLIIVARGGGSLEDLWAFNEEVVVRAVASGSIPLISAVGHETDTTLIDFAADRRAPTPTAAAEMAVPVRRDLQANVLDFERRLITAIARCHEEARTGLRAAVRGLRDPRQLIEVASQRLDDVGESLHRALLVAVERQRRRFADFAGRLQPSRLIQELIARDRQLEGFNDRLAPSLGRAIANFETRLSQTATRLRPLQLSREIAARNDSLAKLASRMPDSLERGLTMLGANLDARGRMLESLSYERVIDRGYALVRDGKTGRPITTARKVKPTHPLAIQFSDGTVPVAVDGEAFGTTELTARKKSKKAPGGDQGQLF